PSGRRIPSMTLTRPRGGPIVRHFLDPMWSAMSGRQRLFTKYATYFIGLVGTVLLVSTAIQLRFAFDERQALLATLQQREARLAALRIDEFARDVYQQLVWANPPGGALAEAGLEQKKADY